MTTESNSHRRTFHDSKLLEWRRDVPDLQGSHRRSNGSSYVEASGTQWNDLSEEFVRNYNASWRHHFLLPGHNSDGRGLQYLKRIMTWIQLMSIHCVWLALESKSTNGWGGTFQNSWCPKLYVHVRDLARKLHRWSDHIHTLSAISKRQENMPQKYEGARRKSIEIFGICHFQRLSQEPPKWKRKLFQFRRQEYCRCQSDPNICNWYIHTNANENRAQLKLTWRR